MLMNFRGGSAFWGCMLRGSVSRDNFYGSIGTYINFGFSSTYSSTRLQNIENIQYIELVGKNEIIRFYMKHTSVECLFFA